MSAATRTWRRCSVAFLSLLLLAQVGSVSPASGAIPPATSADEVAAAVSLAPTGGGGAAEPNPGFASLPQGQWLRLAKHASDPSCTPGYFRSYGDTARSSGPKVSYSTNDWLLPATGGWCKSPAPASPESVKRLVFEYRDGIEYGLAAGGTPVGGGQVRVAGTVVHPDVDQCTQVGSRSLRLAFMTNGGSGGFYVNPPGWQTVATVANLNGNLGCGGDSASFDLTVDIPAAAGRIVLMTSTGTGTNHSLNMVELLVVTSDPGAGPPQLPPARLPDAQLYGMGDGLHGNNPTHYESDPVNTALGNYVTQTTDLALPGRGLDPAFSRTYNSLADGASPAPMNLVRFPIAASAGYSASRAYSASYAAHDAADGISGNSTATGMSWAVNGWQAGDWWQVDWSAPQALTRIELCDRGTASHYFGSAGRITFSDGSTVNWSGLPNDCGATGASTLSIDFPRKSGITWFRVIADTDGLSTAGLAEVQAFDDASTSRRLGPGWTHSYDVRLELDPSGRLTFRSEDGARFVYTPDGSGGYIAPHAAFSTLTALAGGGYLLSRRDQVRYEFDRYGFLTALTDRNGNALTFAYTAGQLTTIADTVGRTVSLAYEDGRLASLSGPPERTVSYGYDASGRLAGVTDASGGVWSYTYTANGQLETLTDPNEHVVVTNEYGADGRVSAQTNATGDRGAFAWDPLTQLSTYTDARGEQWVDAYEDNALLSSTDPLGNTTNYAFDADFNPSSITDPRGNTTTLTYDENGNLVSRTAPAPLSYSETWTYNARNDVATYLDGRSHTTTYEYDPAGNLIRISAPLSAVTEFGRDPAGTGLLISLTDPRAKTTIYGHDGQANLTSVSTPLGNLTTMTFDPAGRMLTLVEPRGNVAGADAAQFTTTFTYDAADELLTATDPLGNVTAQAWDPAGNLSSVTDPNTHATTYGYDNANHLTSVTDAATGVTGYAYDQVGNLTGRTDANLHVTSYAYDNASRLVSTSDPLSHVWSLTYDAAGNVATRSDANLATTTYAHDVLNRLTTATYADTSTPTVTFGYDANGNRTSMVDGAGTETATFDALNRLVAVTRGSDAFAYGYDLAGNLTSRTYPGQSAQTLTYDDDGGLVTANGASHTYDAAANLLTVATPDGLTARYSYDRAGRLLEVAHTTVSDTMSRFTYSLDLAGNRSAMTSREGTVTYRYDVLDRLTEACWSTSTCPGGAPAAPLACLACVGGLAARPAATVIPPPGETFRTYSYDPVGNRLSEASNAGTTAYTYDTADRLTSVTPPGQAAISYTFDNNGNQTAAGADTFTWDLAARLKTANVGGVTESYTYAGDGRRRSAAVGGSTTQSVWDLAFGLPQLALERDGSGTLLRSYTYGLDLLSQKAGNSTYWYHHDGLGSVTDVSSNTGASLEWREYYPYGLLRQAGLATGGGGAPAVQPFRFSGEQLDSLTGLYHLRARQYDPALGRFLREDPIRGSLRNPLVSLYAYVRNMPLVATDPSGMVQEDSRIAADPWSSCAVAAAGELDAAAGPSSGGAVPLSTRATRASAGAERAPSHATRSCRGSAVATPTRLAIPSGRRPPRSQSR